MASGATWLNFRIVLTSMGGFPMITLQLDWHQAFVNGIISVDAFPFGAGLHLWKGPRSTL